MVEINVDPDEKIKACCGNLSSKRSLDSIQDEKTWSAAWILREFGWRFPQRVGFSLGSIHVFNQCSEVENLDPTVKMNNVICRSKRSFLRSQVSSKFQEYRRGCSAKSSVHHVNRGWLAVQYFEGFAPRLLRQFVTIILYHGPPPLHASSDRFHCML